MKQFSKVNESKTEKKLKIQENSLGYLTKEQLKSYLEAAKGFLMAETKNIIQWLTINNETFISDLESDDENVLLGFYNIGKPKNESERELYDWMKSVIDADRYLEIPVFLTKEQFDQIISKQVSPDRIYYQLDNESTHNNLVKKFEPLIHKICKQWVGKLNLEYNDILSIAYEGFVYGIHSYGKKNKRSKATDESVFNMRFYQYVAWTIRNAILDYGNKDAHTVVLSKSQLKQEREEKGYNTKSHTISGDKTISKSDDKGSKVVFDFIDSGEEQITNIDKEELDNLWKEVFKMLEKEFSKKIMYIWYSFNELNGHKKLSNKELADKFNVANSSITYYVMKVNNYIQTNKDIKSKFVDIYELTKECLHDEQDRNSDMSPIKINYDFQIYE